jgi:hypothetical protein
VRSRIKRLEREALASSAGTKPRPLSLLIRHVLDTIQIHKWGRTVYQATDTEINILGMLKAHNRLPDGAGAYTFPSGATITFTDPSKAHISGRVEVEDLPGGVREYVTRIDRAKQPERERRLYELLMEGDEDEA